VAVLATLSGSLLVQQVHAANTDAKPTEPTVADPWNSRLSVDVGADGRYSIGAFPDPSNGDPTTGSFKLLYGWPGTGTTYSTLRIDGADVILGQDAPVTAGPTDSGDTDTTTFSKDSVTATQTLSLVTNPQTGQADAVRITYWVNNGDAVSHEIGARAMLDTDVNDNDGAPFRVPGIGAVTTEQDLSGSAIPDTFQVFQDLSDSSHIASATLRGAEASPPDRLVVAAWPSIYRSPWDYTTSPGRQTTNDSAYAVYWNPQALSPGSSRTYITYYGLANVTVDLTPPIALGLTGPVSLAIAGSDYSPNPFSIVATVSDDGTVPVDGATITLNLPAGLHTSDPATISLGTLDPGDPEQLLTWHVTADPRASATTLTYSVTASGTNSPAKTLSRQIDVPAAAGAFDVRIDERSVGTVFGSVTGKKVLKSEVSPPGGTCGSLWQISTTNNTAFVVHTDTNGNVDGSRIDVGQSISGYLIPGQTALYCVAFTQFNQIFDVLYDMSDPIARTADAAMLLTEVLGFPTGDTTALMNFISSVASNAELQRIAACFGTANPFCAPQAINALMTNAQSRNALLGAILDYAVDVNKSMTLDWLKTHLRKYLLKVVTTGSWVAKFIGQVALSPAGYVAFETVPISAGGGGGGGGGF
jgi:hypothetical protein